MNQALEKLIHELRKLPGVGEKTAQRYAVSIIKESEDSQKSLGNIISTLGKTIKYCSQCFNFSDDSLCMICNNSKRDSKQICVVENVFDILALEKTNNFSGVYHVLHGLLSPLDRIGPEDLRIKELISRLESSEKEEIIFALSPSLEGEATYSYIKDLIPENIKTTQIARGIPTGASIEYADEITLTRALRDRK